MRKTITQLLVMIPIFLLTINQVHSQEYIGVIHNEHIALLNPSTGTVEDATFIALDTGTPKDLLQVGEEIWVSYQIADKIERYDLDGILLSTIDVGLDNIKGLELVNESEIWVTNAGTQNGAPGDAIVKFDINGNNLGHFLTDDISAFDIIDNGNGEVYISYIGGSTTKIERRDYDGVFLGNIVEPGVYNFLQQIELEEPGVILAAVFSGSPQNGIYRFSETDGSVIDFWNLGSLRGVAKLNNGEILWSESGGISSLDPNTGVSTLISAGQSQYFGRLDLEGCTSFPDAPTGDATQNLCDGDTVAELTATGSNIFWYEDSIGGTPLSPEDLLISGNSYFASQTVDGCESEDRFEVVVDLTTVDMPTGDSIQTLLSGATLADIVVDPTDVTWYATEADANSGTNPLDISTLLVDGETYYAVNVVDDCSSEALAVTVIINLSLNDFDYSSLDFYPNPTEGILYLQLDGVISEVEVYTILGQLVIKEETNSKEIEIDMSSLPNASYFVKIISEGNSKAVKVIKK